MRKPYIGFVLVAALVLLLGIDFCFYAADQKWLQSIRTDIYVGMQLPDLINCLRHNLQKGNIGNVVEYGAGQVTHRIPEWKYGGGVYVDFGGKKRWLVFPEYGSGEHWGGEKAHWFVFDRRCRSCVSRLVLEGVDGLLCGHVVVGLDGENKVEKVHLGK